MALNGSCISSHKGSRLVKKCLTIGTIKRNRASLLAAETASAIWKAQNLFGPTSAMQHTPGNYRHNHLRSFRNPFKKTCKGLLLPSASVSSKICPTTTSKIRSCAFICNMFFGTKSSSPRGNVLPRTLTWQWKKRPFEDISPIKNSDFPLSS